MDDTTKKELQSAAFERLVQHLRERKDLQNLDLMNLAGFCRNCLSKWYREEAQKKGIEISSRKKAIIKAIQDLKKYQILIIAGKGHENIQIKKDTTIFFNDLKIAKQELRKKN